MSPDIAIALVAVFASVALSVCLLGALMLRWLTPEQREIRRLAGRGADGIIAELELQDVASPWVKRFQQVVPKSPKEMTRLRRRLTAAGYRERQRRGHLWHCRSDCFPSSSAESR